MGRADRRGSSPIDSTDAFTATSDADSTHPARPDRPDVAIPGCIPTPEVCDSRDNDCDGVIDNVSGVGEPCGLGIGECARSGVGICDPGPGAVVCNAQIGAPASEICDDLDNDCDGETDEDFVRKGQPCVVGHGGCERTGTLECHSDGRGVLCSVQPGVPTETDGTCDGVDDDCDGAIDEDPPCNGCPASTDVPDGWVCIPAGEMWMGSPEEEQGRDIDELTHRVGITQPFLLKATELTQGEWLAVLDDPPSPAYFPECGLACPMESVSWFDALAYLNRWSARDGLDMCYRLEGCTGSATGCPPETETCTGDHACLAAARIVPCNGYRLPTEAEWEYAARAGTRGAVHREEAAWTLDGWCAQALEPIAWYICNSNWTTHPVAGVDPNPWGVWDAIGNVAEWVWDPYHVDYGGIPDPSVPILDPVAGEPSLETRVLRGCGFNEIARRCRAAYRDIATPAWRSSRIGLRPARSWVEPH